MLYNWCAALAHALLFHLLFTVREGRHLLSLMIFLKSLNSPNDLRGKWNSKFHEDPHRLLDCTIYLWATAFWNWPFVPVSPGGPGGPVHPGSPGSPGRPVLNITLPVNEMSMAILYQQIIHTILLLQREKKVAGMSWRLYSDPYGSRPTWDLLIHLRENYLDKSKSLVTISTWG